MTEVAAYAAFDPKLPLGAWKFQRRTLKPHDAILRVEEHFPILAGHLLTSAFAGIADTQQMCNDYVRSATAADTQLIAAEEIQTACRHMLKGDVQYRCVIHCNPLGK